MSYKVMRTLLISTCLTMFVSGCHHQVHPFGYTNGKFDTEKKVVVVVVDSLTNQLLQAASRNPDYPAFHYLVSHGQYIPHVVSSFPSMTVSDISTLVTGVYPNEHRVPGLVWYDADRHSVTNYGNNLQQALILGTRHVSKNILYDLNQTHLSHHVTTIFEELQDEGYQTAAINMLVYRGRRPHRIRIPLYARSLIGVTSYSVHGPDTLVFGQLSEQRTQHTKDGMLHGLGLNDDYAVDTLVHLIERNQLPSFTMIYLPDNDTVLHKHGVNAMKGMVEVNKNLEKILNSYGSWENTLHHLTLVVMGDSGVTPTLSSEHRPTILLKDALPSVIYHWGQEVKKSDDFVVTPNSRMAYVYLISPRHTVREIVSKLRTEQRLNVIAWTQDKDAYVTTPTNRGMPLKFHLKGAFRNPYGQSWSMAGDPRVLDIHIGEHHRIQYGTYPDVLHELWSALHCQHGTYLVVTAKKGYQFGDEHAPQHNGGAQQASLLSQDILAPMIVAGVNHRFTAPTRFADLKQYFISLVKQDIRSSTLYPSE